MLRSLDHFTDQILSLLAIYTESFKGVLSEEFQDTITAYKALRTRWLMIIREFQDLEDSAELPEEKVFWKRLRTRLSENWRKADDLRTQFRLCESSKIGNIVCRNQGKWRSSVPAQSDPANESEADEEDNKDCDTTSPLERFCSDFKRHFDDMLAVEEKPDEVPVPV